MTDVQRQKRNIPGCSHACPVGSPPGWEINARGTNQSCKGPACRTPAGDGEQVAVVAFVRPDDVEVAMADAGLTAVDRQHGPGAIDPVAPAPRCEKYGALPRFPLAFHDVFMANSRTPSGDGDGG